MMFFTRFLNSGIGTKSFLSCILCSPINVSGVIWDSAFIWAFSHLSSHPSSWIAEKSDYCRALKEDERVKRNDSSQIQSSQLPARVCCSRIMFLAELGLSVDIVCQDIDFALVQELSFTCVMSTRARWHKSQAWGWLCLWHWSNPPWWGSQWRGCLKEQLKEPSSKAPCVIPREL